MVMVVVMIVMDGDGCEDDSDVNQINILQIFKGKKMINSLNIIIVLGMQSAHSR